MIEYGPFPVPWYAYGGAAAAALFFVMSGSVFLSTLPRTLDCVKVESGIECAVHGIGSHATAELRSVPYATDRVDIHGHSGRPCLAIDSFDVACKVDNLPTIANNFNTFVKSTDSTFQTTIHSSTSDIVFPALLALAGAFTCTYLVYRIGLCKTRFRITINRHSRIVTVIGTGLASPRRSEFFYDGTETITIARAREQDDNRRDRSGARIEVCKNNQVIARFPDIYIAGDAVHENAAHLLERLLHTP